MQTRQQQNRFKRYLSYFYRSVSPAAKVGQMTGTAVFNGNKLAGLIQNVPFGLGTVTGVILAVVFGTGTIVTTIWIRAFGMWRRSAPPEPVAEAVAAIRNNNSITPSEAENRITSVESLQITVAPPQTTTAQAILNPYKDANFFGPGIPIGLFKHAGYVTLQGFSVVYMFNTIPSAFLSSYSIAQLVARIPGASFDSYCKDGDQTSPVWKLVLVNGVAVLFAYCSNVAYIVYNQPQIKIYYMKLFHEGEIKKISLRTWVETLTGVSINTMVLAYSGSASWNLLKDELFCHFGINNISALFVSFMVLESCATNFIINGIMTLLAVHNRRTTHATDRAALIKEIGFSQTLHNFLLSMILVDAIGNASGSYVAAARFPETVDPTLVGEGIPYLWYVILIAVCVSLLGFSNTRSLSEEGDLRELRVKKTEHEKKLLEVAIERAHENDEVLAAMPMDRMDESSEEKTLNENVNYVPPTPRDERGSLLPVTLSEHLLPATNGRHPELSRAASYFNTVRTLFSPRQQELVHRPTLVNEDYIAELIKENDRLGSATPSSGMCLIM